jgi:hypothetical protein
MWPFATSPSSSSEHIGECTITPQLFTDKWQEYVFTWTAILVTSVSVLYMLWRLLFVLHKMADWAWIGISFLFKLIIGVSKVVTMLAIIALALASLWVYNTLASPTAVWSLLLKQQQQHVP